MQSKTRVCVTIFVAALTALWPWTATGQEGRQKKVFMITDMEGVDGIFDSELQCVPYKSPRYAESQKLLTDEVNAAVEGLLAGGATDVVVWDGHDSSRNLSVLDIHPKALLLVGEPVSPTLELDRSYSAVIFVGQHAMAGADKAILSHSYSSEGIQNIWVNGKLVGEIGAHHAFWILRYSGHHAGGRHRRLRGATRAGLRSRMRRGEIGRQSNGRVYAASCCGAGVDSRKDGASHE